MIITFCSPFFFVSSGIFFLALSIVSFTKEQYKAGIDVPNLGYGGKHRDIKFIINSLTDKFALLEVGFTNGVNQFSTGLNTSATFSFTASMIKAADCFIGAEGGLANLASGVGTKTIITGDFVHQLYGWNGVIKKIKEPIKEEMEVFEKKFPVDSIIEGTISSINDYAIYLRIDGFDLDGFLHANDLSYDKNPEEEIKKYKKGEKLKVKVLEIKPDQQKLRIGSVSYTHLTLPTNREV